MARGTPKWDHGLRVSPGGQLKQRCAKEEKSEAANKKSEGNGSCCSNHS